MELFLYGGVLEKNLFKYGTNVSDQGYKNGARAGHREHTRGLGEGFLANRRHFRVGLLASGIGQQAEALHSGAAGGAVLVERPRIVHGLFACTACSASERLWRQCQLGEAEYGRPARDAKAMSITTGKEG